MTETALKIRHLPLAGACIALALAVGMPLAAHGQSASEAMIDAMRTSGIMRAPGVYSTETFEQLKAGLDALTRDEYEEARAIRDAMPDGAPDRQLLAWSLAYFGGGNLPSGEIAATARELPSWPGKARLRENSERAMLRENPPADVVVKAFGSTTPKTLAGAIILARAHMTLGDNAKAAATMAPFWRETKMDEAEEVRLLEEFGAVLTAADHRHRMEFMLYEERIASADRAAWLADATELSKAWVAVIRGRSDAGALLDKVPEAQRGAGYIYAKSRYLRSKRDYVEAAKTINGAPKERAMLVDPDQWWVERRILSRNLLDAGEQKLAYEVAAGHSAESPSSAAEAEFHAGWYALRALNDAKAAAGHFRAIADIAGGPISLSRSHYWLGRAADAGSGEEAEPHYSKAAAYGTTFYGQLAAARLKRNSIVLDKPVPGRMDRARFGNRQAVTAISRLEQAGHGWRANVLYLALADELESPGELALLADKAEENSNHFIALKIGKAAALRGIDVGALTHPLGAIPEDATIDGAGKALAYAIARQESEFNPGAVSRAGARGLLQLMPATAKGVASRYGLGYSQDRLTSDPAYNATLGAHYLGEQLERFSNSYILTFVAYNAGPRRAQEWVERYGDPVGKDIETVVDWIERIPFTETRSYVQRVMENYQVYKMRLTGKMSIVEDLVQGR